jgi:hypothetical protein
MNAITSEKLHTAWSKTSPIYGAVGVREGIPYTELALPVEYLQLGAGYWSAIGRNRNWEVAAVEQNEDNPVI